MTDSAASSTARAGAMRVESQLHTGERPRPPGGLAAVVACTRAATVGALRGRRLVGLLLVVSLPIVVQTLVLTLGDGRSSGFEQLVKYMNFVFLRIVVPLVSVFLATASLGDEWDGGTAPYVVGLPVPRWAIVLGRFLATLRRTLVLVLPSMLIVALLCLVPHEGALGHYGGQLVWLLASLLMAAVVYTATFLLFGMALRFSILASLIFWFLFELLIPNLPLGLAYMSPAFHIRNVVWQSAGIEGFRLWTFDRQGLVEPPSVLGSSAMLVVWIVVALGITTVILRLRECRGSAVQVTGEGGG